MGGTKETFGKYFDFIDPLGLMDSVFEVDTSDGGAAASDPASEIVDATEGAEAKAAEDARIEAQKRLAKLTQTIYTSPLGLSASQDDKTKLGG